MSITRMRSSFAHILKPALILFALVFVIGAFSQFGGRPGSKGEDGSVGGVVATVNGQQISRAQFDAAYNASLKQATRQMSAISPMQIAQMKSSVLSDLISRSMIMTAAQQSGVRVSWFELRRERPKMVDKMFKQIRDEAARNTKTGKLSDKEFNIMLSRANPPMTIDSLRAALEKDYAGDAGRQQIMVTKLLEKIKGSVGAIDDNRLKDSYRQVQARQIVIGAGATPDAQVRRKADEILKKVKDGGDFAAIAKQFSDDPSTKAKGGDMGFLPVGMLDKEARNLKDGQVSGVIKSPMGYQIVKVEASKYTLPNDFDKNKKKYRDQLKQQLEQEAMMEFQQKMEKSAQVVVKDPELNGYYLADKAMQMQFMTSPQEAMKLIAQAADSLRKAAASKDTAAKPEVYVKLATIYMMQGKKDDAIAVLSDILEGRHLVEDMNLRVMLADLYLQKGDTAKAKPNVAAASDMAYTDPDQQIHQRIKDMAVKVGDGAVASAQDAWLKAHPQPAGSMAGMPMTVTPQPAPKAAKK